MSIHPEQHPLDGKLEPETKDCFNDLAPLYSIAISLKRIADAPSEAAARIAELEGDLKAAFREISKLAREAGEAKGRLEMSEAAGIVDGWRERAERAEARCRALEGAWTWLAGRMNLVLDCDWPDEEDNGVWQVHRVSGSVNDREWELVGSGATPLEAVEAARLSLSGGGGREEADRLIREGHERFVEKHELEPAANHPENPDSSSQRRPNLRSHEQQRSHALASFATQVLEALWENYDLDGGQIQDLGLKFGLIKAVAYDPSTHVDVHGVGPEPGDEWFIQEPWLTDLAAGHQPSDGGRG